MDTNQTTHDTIESIINKGYDVLNEWLSKKDDPCPRQSWTLMDSNKLAKVWKDFVRLGFVRDEKTIAEFQYIILENIGKLHANTIFMGHDRIWPKEHAEALGFDYITEEDFEGFEDFVTDNNGAWRITDYAMDKLINGSLALANADTAEQKLLAIDHILNIVHQRSDLASWFVKGGTKTLNNIAYN